MTPNIYDKLKIKLSVIIKYEITIVCFTLKHLMIIPAFLVRQVKKKNVSQNCWSFLCLPGEHRALRLTLGKMWTKDFRNLWKINISACIFNFNWLHRLQSWGPDASLDTYNDSVDQLWRLWRLWPYPYYGHYGDIAIVAIVTIDDIRPLILVDGIS